MDFKDIAAEAFGLAPDAVTDAHIAVIQSIADKTAPVEKDIHAPTLDLGAAKIAEVEDKLQAEITDLKRQMAEAKRPGVDEEEAHKDAQAMARTKHLPDILTAVHDEDLQEPEIKAFRKQWDKLHLLSVAMGSVRTGPVPVRRLSYWKQIEARYPEFANAINKAVDTATATGGAEWAPTLYSSDLQQEVYNKCVVAPLFPRVPAPRHSWVLPFQPTGGTVYLAGEATTDAAADYTSTTPTSRNSTITSKKLIGRIPWSEEFDEDSVIAAEPLFRTHLVRLMAEHIDSAIMNGDTTATHMDTGKSYTSTSAEAAWDGLRDLAMHTLTSCSTSLATFSGDTVMGLTALMEDKFVDDPGSMVIFTPTKIRGKWFTMIDNATNKNPVYQRSTPMGDEVVRTGAFMDFYGTPVVSTFTLWSNVNASGIYDGSTKTKSAIICVHRDSFLLTDRKELSLIGYDQPLKGLRNLIANWRGSFNCLQPSTVNYAAYGYNISTA